MKRLSILLFSVIALFLGACEEHSAKETRESVKEEGEVAAAGSDGGAAKPEQSPANTGGANPTEQRPAGENEGPKPESPKFFDSK